jgi:hypothetical protein
MSDTGMIRVTASSSPSTPRFCIPATIAVEVDYIDGLTSLESGFHQEWISGTGEGVSFELTAGSGLGSPWLSFSVKREGDGEGRQYRIDTRKLVRVLLDSDEASRKAEAEAESTTT